MATTIRLYDGDLGGEEMLLRCDLTRPDSPVEVDYCEGSGWQPTQYQCADARHRTDELVKLGEILAAAAVEVSAEEFECDSAVIA